MSGDLRLVLRDSRIGAPGRQVFTISATATLDELLEQVCLVLQTDPDTIDLIVGVPPHPIHLDGDVDGERTLLDLKIPTGEQLRAQAKSLTGVQAQGQGKFKARRSKKASSSPSTLSLRTEKTENKKRRTTKVTAGSKEDVAGHLVSALKGGSTSRDKTLRNVFSSALEGRYEESKAIDRHGSLAVNSYRFSLPADPDGKDALTEATVTYPAGAGVTRGSIKVAEHIDTFTLMPRSILKSILESFFFLADTDREYLRPVNLAKASPKVFWNLVRFFSGDIVFGLKSLLPDKDFEWMEGRKREQSEKAKRNQEQQHDDEENKSKRKREMKKTTPPTSPRVNGGRTSSCGILGGGGGGGCESEALVLVRSILDREFGGVIIDEASPIYSKTVTAAGGSKLCHLADSKITRGSNTNWKACTTWARRLDGLVAAAQSHVFKLIFIGVLCGGSRALYRALKALRCNTIGRLHSWRHASLVPVLHRKLLELDPSLATLELLRCEESSVSASPVVDKGVTVDRIAWMTQVCDAFQSLCDWAVFFDAVTTEHSNDIYDTEDQDEDEDRSIGDWRSDSGWKTTGSPVEYIGKRVRWVYEEDESGLWSEGIVVAHAPPIEADDIELWKVEYTLPSGASRFLDLERDELDKALKRVPFSK